MEQEIEIWRSVIFYSEGDQQWYDYTGYYEVSNFGRVRSVERIVKHNYGGEAKKKGKERIPETNKNGYNLIGLYRDNKTKMVKVARLIGFAFPEICGEWFNGAQINHLNEIRNDDRAINLKWATHIENQLWGTRIDRISKNNCRSVVCKSLQGEVIKIYNSLKEAAKETGVSHQLISGCARHKTKKAGGFIWEYA